MRRGVRRSWRLTAASKLAVAEVAGVVRYVRDSCLFVPPTCHLHIPAPPPIPRCGALHFRPAPLECLMRFRRLRMQLDRRGSCSEGGAVLCPEEQERLSSRAVFLRFFRYNRGHVASRAPTLCLITFFSEVSFTPAPPTLPSSCHCSAFAARFLEGVDLQRIRMEDVRSSSRLLQVQVYPR